MYDGPQRQPIRIEASQKGWLAIRALLELADAIAAIQVGEADWRRYEEAKQALREFERWYGR